MNNLYAQTNAYGVLNHTSVNQSSSCHYNSVSEPYWFLSTASTLTLPIRFDSRKLTSIDQGPFAALLFSSPTDEDICRSIRLSSTHP